MVMICILTEKKQKLLYVGLKENTGSKVVHIISIKTTSKSRLHLQQRYSWKKTKNAWFAAKNTAVKTEEKTLTSVLHVTKKEENESQRN